MSVSLILGICLMSHISIEFFPPKTPEGAEKLRAVRKTLYALKPQFCSVTYGAGGATQAGTFATVGEILKEGVDAASHFSCIGASAAKVRLELEELKAMGVKIDELTPAQKKYLASWQEGT